MDLLAQNSLTVADQLSLFSPMIALVCTMLAVVGAPLVVGRSPRTIAFAGAIGIGAAFILCFRVWKLVAGGGQSGFSTSQASGMLLADNLSVAFQFVLLLFLGSVTWLWWMGSAEKERNAPEFFILLLGSAVGMILMVSTANLLMIVIAIETASLPSYAIVGFDKRDRRGAEASLKYMIFGAISAAIMLYGASLLYGLVGSLNVAEVARYTYMNLAGSENRLLLAVALLCFFAGIAFKISAVPFHFWCPDAFEGAKIEVTTWLSVASKAAGLILLARLVVAFCANVDTAIGIHLIRSLAWVIGMIAAATCTLGNFSAYKQESVKRLLAYSSIAHAGYMMMAAAVFLHPSSADHSSALTALLMYVVIYLFMNLGAFGVTAMVIWDTGSDRIEAFTGLIRRSPWLAVPMIVCLMSLVGLPPFAGFMGKWWVLVALGNLDRADVATGMFSLSTLAWVLVIVAVLNTLFSLYYYLRIVVQMALYDDGRALVRAPAGGLIMVNLCAIALFVLFVGVAPLKATTDRFARNLFPSVARLNPIAAIHEAGN